MNELNETILSALLPWIPAENDIEYAEYCQGEVESAITEYNERHNHE